MAVRVRNAADELQEFIDGVVGLGAQPRDKLGATAARTKDAAVEIEGR